VANYEFDPSMVPQVKAITGMEELQHNLNQEREALNRSMDEVGARIRAEREADRRQARWLLRVAVVALFVSVAALIVAVVALV